MSKYVVSEDICVLLSLWAKKYGFLPPQPQFLRGLRTAMKNELERIFGQGKIDFLEADHLIIGLKKLTAESGLMPVSLDKSYFFTNHQIEMTRAVDANLADCGESERFGQEKLETQIQKLSLVLPSEIALVDDVIFSGNGIIRLINLFAQRKIAVKKIIAGISIGEGREKIQKLGAEVVSVFHYANVIDEICERDFYPGVPLSGRYVSNQTKETGAPYLYPFGKPTEWASIPPEQAENFSRFCLRQTANLWRHIGSISGKEVFSQDIWRLPIGLNGSPSCFASQLEALLPGEV